MAVGTIAPLGYGRETTPGTGVAATTWLPAMDASGDTDLALQFPELITNTRQVNRYSLQGQQKTRGTVKFNLFQDMGVDLIIGAFGTPTGTTPLWAGTYVPTAGTLLSWSIELQKGAIQTFRLVGAMVDKFKVTMKAGAQIEVQLDLVALDYLSGITPGTPSYTATDPYNFSEVLAATGAVTAAATDLDVTDVEFTLDNHLMEQWTMQAATAAPRRIDAAKTTLTGKLTKYFADMTLYTAYRARTYQQLQFTAARAGHSAIFNVPRASIKTHKQPVKLGQFIVQEFDFVGTLDATTGGILQLITA
jgi:tail tube protein